MGVDSPPTDNLTMKRMPGALTEQAFDLLILGGGITGAGVALDASLRGLRVALIDKGDFASGTSSISSKLVHGGLRYLEHGEIHLVYEALRERGRLLSNAPHLVWPLRFVLPFYRGERVPPWKWRAGLLLYDLLAGSSNIHRARACPVRSLEREFPGLLRTGLLGGAEYWDAQMDDARLCLEVLRTASKQGLKAANYVEAVGFEKSAGRIVGVHALDRLTGSGTAQAVRSEPDGLRRSASGQQTLTIRARQVLNATGPWADSIRKLAGEEGGPLLRPTKGVHLIAPGLFADRETGFLLLHPADGRVFFVLPWLGKTVIGTTDTECAESPDQLSITAEDVRYLLEGYNHYFAPPLAEADLLGRFVGLRPLLQGNRNNPSALSREYHLSLSPAGLLTVAGGKYTTFRRMAETITDLVVRRLGLSRRCRTKTFRLDGTPPGDWPLFREATVQSLVRSSGLEPASARHLVNRYGRRAADVVALGRGQPELWQPVVPGEPDLRVEFLFHREHEMAILPEDYLLRRTRLGLFHLHLLQEQQEQPFSGNNLTTTFVQIK